MDRTNWKFGLTDMNILTIGVVYQGVAFSIVFKLLPKKGNSNTKKTTETWSITLSCFGKSSIKRTFCRP